MAGYSGTPLLKKLGIKPNYTVLAVNAPDHYLGMLGEFPEGAKQVSEDYPELIDFIHVFCNTEE